MDFGIERREAIKRRDSLVNCAGGFSGKGVVIIAAYDRHGRMLDCKTTTVANLSARADDAMTLSTEPDEQYRVFLVNDQTLALSQMN